MQFLFLQKTPSQIDAPFYKRLYEKNRLTTVWVWNDYGLERKKIDPELGVIPEFPQLGNDGMYWIDKKKFGLIKILRKILGGGFTHVLFQDQSWKEKILLSIALKLFGVKVGFRSDKNKWSETARSGFKKTLEGSVVRLIFDFYAPVSEATKDYYSIKKDYIYFPYCTDEGKFVDYGENRPDRACFIRKDLDISPTAYVFLAVIKFSERENPLTTLKLFIDSARIINDSAYIIVGDGPLKPEMHACLQESGLNNIKLVGYVPYDVLQDYFYAADAFVHIPKYGPWEISVPDALICGKAIMASEPVGAAHCCLVQEAKKYIVDSDNFDLMKERMKNLYEDQSSDVFFDSKKKTLENYSVGAAVIKWSKFLDDISRS